MQYETLNSVNTITTFQLIQMVMVKILNYKLSINDEHENILEFKNTNPDFCHHIIVFDSNKKIECVSDVSIVIALLKNEPNADIQKEKIAIMISTVFSHFTRKTVN
ncbi:hypothetical protein [Pedobacter mucosus]|uniref:hypothetical protein n=1 Tax=Pedobacter mucosus TaxID=2895286 RepID=UPI001EE3EDE4|nr:hypothetical protein [Pedobacter mucosus]UKT62270.1 hypothetical protein LOK61_10900 [Pedobacter mucosus]